MVHFCSVPQCRGKWRSGYLLRFHAFPKDDESCKLWQKAIGRLNPPSSSMKVCSRHFKDDDYQILWSGCKRLKKCAVPSVYLPSKVDAFSQTDGMINVSSMTDLNSSFAVKSYSHHQPTSETPFQEDNCLEVNIKEELNQTTSMQVEIGSSEKVNLGSPKSNNEWNNSEFEYLSGVSESCFHNLFVVLTGESLTLPSCNASAQDQLLLTLCKYKHNFSFTLLSIIFKIKQVDAHAVFLFWTYHMEKILKLRSGMSVKAEERIQCSVSVGIVHVPVSEPSSLCAYRWGHSETEELSFLKSLVVIDDYGQSVMYCSKLYGQFTSNDCLLADGEFQQCLARSSLINLNETLNLSKLFSDKDVQVILSDKAPCLCQKGGESMSSVFSSFMLTKQFQCLVDFYKILSDGFPSNLLSISSEILFNSMMLFNFACPKPIDNVACAHLIDAWGLHRTSCIHQLT